MGCCGGGFPGSGGGGGGDLSGTLTAPLIPYASAPHTLSDTVIQYDPLTGAILTQDIQVGANILLDHFIGQIDSEFLHVHSNATIDGLLSLGVAGLDVNLGKFTVDGATGDVDAAGDLHVAGEIYFEKRSRKTVVPVAPVALVAAVDAALGDVFAIAPGGVGDTVITTPSNPPPAGQTQGIVLRLESLGDATKTMSFDFGYNFSVVPVFDWSLTGYYYLGFLFNDVTSKWDDVGPLIGPFS